MDPVSIILLASSAMSALSPLIAGIIDFKNKNRYMRMLKSKMQSISNLNSAQAKSFRAEEFIDSLIDDLSSIDNNTKFNLNKVRTNLKNKIKGLKHAKESLIDVREKFDDQLNRLETVDIRTDSGLSAPQAIFNKFSNASESDRLERIKNSNYDVKRKLSIIKNSGKPNSREFINKFIDKEEEKL